MTGVSVSRSRVSNQWLPTLSGFTTIIEVFDLLVVVVAGLLTAWIRFGTLDLTGERGLVLVVGVFVAYFAFRWVKLHDPAILGRSVAQVRRAATGTLLTFFIVLAIGYLTKTGEEFSRLWIGGWWVTTFCALILSRYLVVLSFRRLETSSAFQIKYVIFSTASEIQRVEAFIARWRRLMPESTVIEGVFLDDPTSAQSAIGPLQNLIKGRVSEFAAWNEGRQIENAVTILPPNDREVVRRHLEELSSLSLDVNIVAGEVDEIWAEREVDKIAGLPVLRIMSRPLTTGQVALKRGVDIVLASIALVLVGPLMLMIALAIKLDSRGPALFRQQRNGFNNRPFTVLKYRSMYYTNDVLGTVAQAQRSDPRVTRIGRVLRRTSMDELPQILNVLRGDMSLVGPRPLAIQHNEEYSKLIDSYLARHRIKPGITGWAQVHGLRGETQTVDLMKKRIEYDLYYADNWSLGLDLEIILRTFGCLIHKNAY